MRGQLARTVLRGPGRSNASRLPDRRLDFRFPTGAPGQPAFVVYGGRSPVMREPEELEDARHEQYLQRVCAIDVAKASGKVCIRVPHPSRPGATADPGVGCGRHH